MSTARAKRSVKAGEPTISGTDPDSNSEEPAEEVVADESTPKRSEDPLGSLSYEQYKLDMVILARFVKEETFDLIVDTRLPVPDELRAEYKRVSPVLRRTNGIIVQVLETLDRWSVPAYCLREISLMDEEVVDVPQGARYSLLSSLVTRLRQLLGVSWQSVKPEEPAEFWKVSPELTVVSPATQPPAISMSAPVVVNAPAIDPVELKLQQPVQPKPSQDARKIALGGGVRSIEKPEESVKIETVVKSESKPRKSRVDRGTDEDGVTREKCFKRIQLIMERNLARYLYAVAQPLTGNDAQAAQELPTIFPVLSQLLQQAMDEARHAMSKVTLPLFKQDFFDIGFNELNGKFWTNERIMVIPHPFPTDKDGKPDLDEEFQTTLAFWRLKHFESQTFFGNLSQTAQTEWSRIFEDFYNECKGVMKICEKQLGKTVMRCDRFDANLLFPIFRLSRADHEAEDQDTVLKPYFVPGPIEKVAPVVTEVFSSSESSILSVNSEDSHHRRQAEMKENDYRSGVYTETSMASDDTVTADEMEESWLLYYGDRAIDGPNAATKNVSKQAEVMILKLSLTTLSAGSVLKLAEEMKDLYGIYKDVAIPWLAVIDRTLESVILSKCKDVFPGTIKTLNQLNARQMLKILGRLCEAPMWAQFRQMAERILCHKDFKVDIKAPRIEQWRTMQRSLMLLELLIPLFGRPLSKSGGFLNSRLSQFANFLETILPKHLIGVILDELYSETVLQLKRNWDFKLPEKAQQWLWGAHVMQFLSMLQKRVSDEAEKERQFDARAAAMYDDRPEPDLYPSRNSKVHHMTSNGDGEMSWTHEDWENFHGQSDDESESLNLALLHSYSPKDQRRPVTTHAYGRSGSGSPTPKLSNAIERSVHFQQRSSERAPDQVCFSYANTTTCSRGNECRYRHLDPSKQDEARLLIDHFKAQAQSHQAKRPGALHLVDEAEEVQTVKPRIAPPDKDD